MSDIGNIFIFAVCGALALASIIYGEITDAFIFVMLGILYYRTMDK